MPERLLPHELDLSGHWRAIVADDELRRTWQHVDWDDAAMVDVDVPGHWRRHPAFADSDGPLLYRRRFQSLAPVGDERAWLVFDRLCAQGDVWLDGGYLGDTEGAFAPHRFEVTASVHDRREHVLGVEVTSPPVGDPRRQARSARHLARRPLRHPGLEPRRAVGARAPPTHRPGGDHRTSGAVHRSQRRARRRGLLVDARRDRADHGHHRHPDRVHRPRPDAWARRRRQRGVLHRRRRATATCGGRGRSARSRCATSTSRSTSAAASGVAGEATARARPTSGAATTSRPGSGCGRWRCETGSSR